MTADRSDLRRGQAHLKEATDGLVAQIVEVEVSTGDLASKPVPGQFERIGGKGEHTTIRTWQFAKNLSGAMGQGDRSRLTILAVWDKEKTARQVNVLPREA
jgi:hypothetical protein